MFKRVLCFLCVVSTLVAACVFSVSASLSDSITVVFSFKGSSSTPPVSAPNSASFSIESQSVSVSVIPAGFYRFSLPELSNPSSSDGSSLIVSDILECANLFDLDRFYAGRAGVFSSGSFFNPDSDYYFYFPSDTPVYSSSFVIERSVFFSKPPSDDVSVNWPSYSANWVLTPVSVSEVPSDVVSQFPDYSRVTYSSGSAYPADVSLSRQSWQSALNDNSTYFSPYPLALHFPWTVSGGVSNWVPNGIFSIHQFYEVSLPSGYFKLSFFDSLSPSLNLSLFGVTPGDLLELSPKSHDFSIPGSYSSWNIPSDLRSKLNSDGYYYLSAPTHYVLDRVISFDLSVNVLPSSADLSMVAPPLPTITVTPFTRNSEVVTGGDIPSISVSSSEGAQEVFDSALLQALSNFYTQYQLNFHSSGYAGVSVYDPSRDFYDLESTYFPNVNTLQLLALQTYNNSRNEIGILNLLNRISRSVLPISNISNVFQQSISSQSQILFSQFSFLQGWLDDFKINWGLSYLTDKDFYQSQESSNAQLHSDIWTLISTVRSLQPGDSATRPWEDFEDNYITSNGESILGAGAAVESSDALDVLQDLSSGVKSGNFDNSSLSSSAGVVSGSSESPMYGLWSDDTVDAFNGDVDEWYSGFEERVSSW